MAKLISGGMYSPFFITYQSGYDTHSDQLNRHGQLLSELSTALNNFYTDLNNQGLSDKVIRVGNSIRCQPRFSPLTIHDIPLVKNTV